MLKSFKWHTIILRTKSKFLPVSLQSVPYLFFQTHLVSLLPSLPIFKLHQFILLFSSCRQNLSFHSIIALTVPSAWVFLPLWLHDLPLLIIQDSSVLGTFMYIYSRNYILHESFFNIKNSPKYVQKCQKFFKRENRFYITKKMDSFQEFKI